MEEFGEHNVCGSNSPYREVDSFSFIKWRPGIIKPQMANFPLYGPNGFLVSSALETWL